MRPKASFRKEVARRSRDGGLYFAAGEMYEVCQCSETSFTSYVRFANAIPTALRAEPLSKGAFWCGTEAFCVKGPPGLRPMSLN